MDVRLGKTIHDALHAPVPSARHLQVDDVGYVHIRGFFMKSTHRYFVSQHFGRASIVVYRDAPGEGIVRLSVEHSGRIMDFTFSRKAVALLSPDPALLDEALTRHAITQAHKLHRCLKTLQDCRFELEISNRLWLGDFLVEPYGGATTGFAQRTKDRLATVRAERRKDLLTYTIVERAIQRQRHAGNNVATATINDHEVPEQVRLRILTGAAIRRQRQ